MDVPEISMRRQEIKLDIPEFKIAQQRIVLKIPDFTLVNVEAQQKSTQDQSKALSENISSESASISGRMKTELKSTTADKLTAIFSCTENNIISQRTNSLSEVDGQIDSFTKQAEQARVQKNETVAAAIEGTVKALIASRDQVKAEFEKALVQIRKARDEALAANAKDA